MCRLSMEIRDPGIDAYFGSAALWFSVILCGLCVRPFRI